jgi:superfamily II DNA helicase RecQ
MLRNLISIALGLIPPTTVDLIQEKRQKYAIMDAGQSASYCCHKCFRMGIDKADVKTVIHIQLPENLENYYQEAGRSGNGEKLCCFTN